VRFNRQRRGWVTSFNTVPLFRVFNIVIIFVLLRNLISVLSILVSFAGRGREGRPWLRVDFMSIRRSTVDNDTEWLGTTFYIVSRVPIEITKVLMRQIVNYSRPFKGIVLWFRGVGRVVEGQSQSSRGYVGFSLISHCIKFFSEGVSKVYI
jgi:hypothetical protein